MIPVTILAFLTYSLLFGHIHNWRISSGSTQLSLPSLFYFFLIFFFQKAGHQPSADGRAGDSVSHTNKRVSHGLSWIIHYRLSSTPVKPTEQKPRFTALPPHTMLFCTTWTYSNVKTKYKCVDWFLPRGPQTSKTKWTPASPGTRQGLSS